MTFNQAKSLRSEVVQSGEYSRETFRSFLSIRRSEGHKKNGESFTKACSDRMKENSFKLSR